MEQDSEEYKNFKEKFSERLLNGDLEIAERLNAQGIHPYQGWKKVFCVSLFDENHVHDLGRELRRKGFIFSRYENDGHTKLNEYLNGWMDANNVEKVWHLVLKRKRGHICPLSELRQGHQREKSTTVRHFREQKIPVVAVGFHHRPLPLNEDDERKIDIHSHSMLSAPLTAEQLNFLNKHYDVYCKEHRDPESLLQYMRKGFARHAKEVDDTELAEYWRQANGLRRFSKLGDFRRYCALMSTLEEEDTYRPKLTAMVHVAGPTLLTVKMITCKDGTEEPFIFVRAGSFDANTHKELERKYDLVAWREYFLNVTTPDVTKTKNRNVNTGFRNWNYDDYHDQ